MGEVALEPREPQETQVSEPNAPRIGITWVTPGQQTSERYLDAVRKAGGQPVPLLSKAISWNDELPALRGLLLTGGTDIDPHHYGEENHGLTRGIVPQRDRLEFEVLKYCLNRGLPILAICRGIQLLNVGLGGSLIQDIESSIEHEAIEGVSSYHTAQVLPGTILSSLVDGQQLRLNSRHHQGMEASHLAEGLVANCLAPDGIIEGVEAPGDHFVLGVQCHPERLDETPELFPVLQAFIFRAASWR